MITYGMKTSNSGSPSMLSRRPCCMDKLKREKCHSLSLEMVNSHVHSLNEIIRKHVISKVLYNFGIYEFHNSELSALFHFPFFLIFLQCDSWSHFKPFILFSGLNNLLSGCNVTVRRLKMFKKLTKLNSKKVFIFFLRKKRCGKHKRTLAKDQSTICISRLKTQTIIETQC